MSDDEGDMVRLSVGFPSERQRIKRERVVVNRDYTLRG
jgi:hypothetical protein